MMKLFRACVAAVLFGSGAGLLCAQEVLRGEVMVELEPVYGLYVEEKYPLDREDAYRRALEQGALFFSASIYGWSFDYDIGERARGIEEYFELTPLGEIFWGDTALNVTHADFRNMRLWVWMDYRLRESQLRRVEALKAGRSAGAVGYGPLEAPAGSVDSNGSDGSEEGAVPSWLGVRKAALEDAARAAIRAMLQGSERNRPKQARGFISLRSFPVYWIDSGRWACSARFRVEIREIIPFSAY